MPLRISDAAGYGSYSMMASAINFAADHGAKVASISFAGVAGSSTISSAANYMRSKGGVVACGVQSGALAFSGFDDLVGSCILHGDDGIRLEF